MKTRNFVRLAGAAALLCAVSMAQAGPIPNAPTAEAFSQLSPIAGPKLSPNGMKMAARVAKDGEYTLMILPLGGGGSPAAVSLGDYDLLEWQWVNNDWLVVKVGMTEDLLSVKDVYMTRAMGVSADGSKVVPLLKGSQYAGQHGGDIVWVANDGSPRVMLSAQRSLRSDLGWWPEVQMVDVSTGDHEPVVNSQNGIMYWQTDGNGVVRLGTGRTIGTVGQPRMTYRSGPNSAFRDLPMKDDDGTPDPVMFLDGDKAVAIADDDKGFSAVYEYDFATQKLGKTLYASKGYDIGGVIPTPDGKGIAGVGYDEDSTKVEWIDPRMKELQGEIDGLLVNAGASIVSFSDDYGRAIVRAGAPETPGAYYLYDRKTKSMNSLAKINSAIGTRRLNPVKTVRYKARDGLEIEAILTTPVGRPAANLPVIAMPHGGPFARDTMEWDFWVQHLASLGYAVIQPNYRGSSGYGSAFTEKGEGQWGLKMQDDVDDAIAFLAKEGIADANRACIVGASYGGYAAMRAAQRGGVYKCAISYAGVSDLNRWGREGGDMFKKKRKQWLRDQAPDFAAVSPVYHAGDFSIPILIVHGAKDQRVGVAHSRDMVKKLKEAGKTFEYIEQPLADHHFSRSADRLEFLKAEEAFLRKYNPS